MNGYDMVTVDDDKIGTIVGTHGDYLIVESGTLRKSRHAVPTTFAHPLEDDGLVRVTLSKEIVADSPALHGDDFDEVAIAQHYGLASGYEQPETEGDGDVLPDDPADSAVVDGMRHGVEPADKQRAEIREGRHDASTPAVHDRPATAVDPFGQTANR
jgi:hypothetical protein